MINFSEEQKSIINDDEHNIIVDAVAGSGKTTTIIGIYERCVASGKRVLILTYNNRLQKETKRRLPDADVFTFHSFVRKTYNVPCENDSMLHDFLGSNIPHVDVMYDVIIADEIQDMYWTVFKLFCTIVMYHSSDDRQVIVLGDPKQNIYHGLNCSDQRYLTLAQRIFSGVLDLGRTWKKYSLNTSYRCPKITCEFMTKMDSPITMNGVRNGRIILVDTCRQAVAKKVIFGVQQCIDHGYGADDIFILMPSVSLDRVGGVKSEYTKLVKEIADGIKRCVRPAINVIVTGDTEVKKQELYNNKLCISTFHKAKGLERKVVFVLYFDQIYMESFTRKREECIPNEMYVAMTRASELLVLYKYRDQPYLPFVNATHKRILRNACDIERPIKISQAYNTLGVTTYIHRLSSELKLLIKPEFSEEQIYSPIRSPGYVKGVDENTFEDISHINGKLVTKIYECTKKGIETDNLFKQCLQEESEQGFLYTEMQVDPEYDPVPNIKDIVVDSIDALNLNNKFESEKPVEGTVAGQKVSGRIDMLSGNDLIEFKYVNEVTIDMKLQLIIYKKLLGHKGNAYIYNIRTGTRYTLIDEGNTFAVLDLGSREKAELNDDEFVNLCHSIVLPERDDKDVFY